MSPEAAPEVLRRPEAFRSGPNPRSWGDNIPLTARVRSFASLPRRAEAAGRPFGTADE